MPPPPVGPQPKLPPYPPFVPAAPPLPPVAPPTPPSPPLAPFANVPRAPPADLTLRLLDRTNEALDVNDSARASAIVTGPAGNASTIETYAGMCYHYDELQETARTPTCYVHDPLVEFLRTGLVPSNQQSETLA